MADKKNKFYPCDPGQLDPADAIREQHEKETREFAKMKEQLEEYGLIMQSCIEEAERTIQIWRGTPRMIRRDTEVFLAMMPAVSVALFEKVTRKTGLRDDMRLMIREIAFQSFVKFIARYPDKIDAAVESASEEEGAEP